MPISSFSSSIVWAAVAWSRTSPSCASISLSGASSQVFEIFAVERQHGRRGDEIGLALALQPLHLLQAALQPFAAAAQGTVDRLRRRGETALQDGQGEADGAGPFVVCQRAGAVKLFANVLGYRRIEPLFLCRQFVGDRVGHPLGEKGRAVELEQLLFDHAAHQVGDIDVVNAIAVLALKTIAVQQRHEKLEVLLFAVVGA